MGKSNNMSHISLLCGVIILIIFTFYILYKIFVKLLTSSNKVLIHKISQTTTRSIDAILKDSNKQLKELADQIRKGESL